MIESTFQNHYKFGYNGEYWNDRKSVYDQWFFSVGECKSYLEFNEELKNAARLLHLKCDGYNPTILFSGGIDSELCVKTFLDLNLPFNVAIGDWAGYNSYDINYAISFCEKHNLNYKIYHLNLLNFFESSFCEYLINITKTDNLYTLPQMWLMSQTKFPVLGNGEPDLYLNENNMWVISFKEQVSMWHKFLFKTNQQGFGGFFEYTPQLMISYLNSIFLHQDIKERKIVSFKNFKPYFLSSMFNLELRPKFTGFENWHTKNEDFVYKFMDKIGYLPKKTNESNRPTKLRNSIEIDLYMLKNMLHKNITS